MAHDSDARRFYRSNEFKGFRKISASGPTRFAWWKVCLRKSEKVMTRYLLSLDWMQVLHLRNTPKYTPIFSRSLEIPCLHPLQSPVEPHSWVCRNKAFDALDDKQILTAPLFALETSGNLLRLRAIFWAPSMILWNIFRTLRQPSCVQVRPIYQTSSPCFYFVHSKWRHL